MNTDLIIVWDGAHRGQNEDLLCCASLVRVPVEDLTPPPFSRVHRRFSEAQVHARACRAAILACLAQRQMTAASLQAVTGFSNADIVAGILYLRKYAKVVPEVLPMSCRTERGTWKQYRRVM